MLQVTFVLPPEGRRQLARTVPCKALPPAAPFPRCPNRLLLRRYGRPSWNRPSSATSHHVLEKVPLHRPMPVRSPARWKSRRGRDRRRSPESSQSSKSSSCSGAAANHCLPVGHELLRELHAVVIKGNDKDRELMVRLVDNNNIALVGSEPRLVQKDGKDQHLASSSTVRD